MEKTAGAHCRCGAWLGSLGLEPTPGLYIEHIVECFRAVKRVLRHDGVVWVNMGDSYAGSGKGPSVSLQPLASQMQRIGPQPHTIGSGHVPGCKPKDLMMLPARVAMALQADGWYLRSMTPWLKRNSMPESVSDRPASSVEYVFLLSRSGSATFWTHRNHAGSRSRPAPDYLWQDIADHHTETATEPANWRTELLADGKTKRWRRINLWAAHDYYWDADAVRVASSENTHSRGNGLGPKQQASEFGQGIKNNNDFGAAVHGYVHNRNRRNSDWFFESWQGLLLDEQDAPLALVVNPAPLKIAHYASFPPKLVEPMIKASTSEKGCCPECGSPWVRTMQRRFIPQADVRDPAKLVKASNKGMDSSNGWGETPRGTVEVATVGWRPTCNHEGEPVPQTVLDPFAGASTTLLVADRLNRQGVGCELSESYADMGTDRLVGDGPMFVSVDVA